MADHKAVPFFAFIEEEKQISELRAYLTSAPRNAKIKQTGPSDLCDNLIEICGALSIMGGCPNPIEVDFILNSVCSLIVTVPADRAPAVVDAFTKAITPQFFTGVGWGSNERYAVRVISNIFHAFSSNAAVQEKVYRSLISLCTESRLIGEVDTSVEMLQKHFERWNTSIEGQRTLLRLVHRALLADQRADQASKVMSHLLGTYTDADAASARDDATECVRTAVVDPKSFSFDHLQKLSAVKALQKSDQLMHSVLELFISGTLKDYRAFVKANPDFVQQKLKVDEEILFKKIRLLTLMTIAEASNTISLDHLAAELDLPSDEELEEFIIEAIQVNAISGKINEMNRTLVVSSFQHRQFDRDQWFALQNRLKCLIANVRQANSQVKNINQHLEVAV